MVLSSSSSPIRIEKNPSFLDTPIIDMSCKRRSFLSESVVKASEKYGFFTVINHGISKDVVDGMEREGFDFFAKPCLEKRKLARGPSPLGYGMKNIGLSGDIGEVEYVLLPTNPHSIAQFISQDPTSINSCIVNDYTQRVRNLACEILELMAEGLHVNKYALSNLIRDIDSDSLIRLNHYPPYKDTSSLDTRIGFGQHSDPQILTILRSNHVGGLQILLEDGLWVPVAPHPMAFSVLVGDTLQVLTNGRFKSVIHRVLADRNKARMSVMYFGAPPLHALISPLTDMVSSPPNQSLYRPFTWGEYKKTSYSLRLGECRLDLFNVQIEDDNTVPQYMEETTHTVHQHNSHNV